MHLVVQPSLPWVTTQLLSVPYVMYAKSAGTVSGSSGMATK